MGGCVFQWFFSFCDLTALAMECRLCEIRVGSFSGHNFSSCKKC